MYQYSGHPFIDIGVATILAFVHKENPDEITLEEMEKVADYIARNYTIDPLRSFLTTVFPNSGFTQPAYFNEPGKQQLYAERTLRSFYPHIPKTAERDPFLGKATPTVSYDVKGTLPAGRAYRQHIPLLTGENVINFFPYGDAGMPLSGEAMLAIQAFPLGCAKCAGKLLAVHSDNPEILLHFAGTFLENNRRLIQIAQQEKSSKLPESRQTLRTLVIDTLLEASALQRDYLQVYSEEAQPFSITVYHVSNSGQSPSLDIYYLPSQVIAFMREMMKADYQGDWTKIVRRAWEVQPAAKNKKQDEQGAFVPRKNYIYEDLFGLPDNARRFIQTYFLRTALRTAKMEPGDPRKEYSAMKEMDIVSWKITKEFLRRIMNMETTRIEQIRQMGDHLAEYVHSQNDKRFFQDFFMENRYEYFRSRLLKVNLSHVRRGNSPLLQFDPYIQVFEEGNELAYHDWRLARDLVLIRMVERLYVLNWFGQNPDVLAVDLPEDEKED